MCGLSCRPSKLQPPVRPWTIWPQGQPCLRLCIRCECVYIYLTFIHWWMLLSKSTYIAFILCIWLVWVFLGNWAHDFVVASAMYYQLSCSVSLTRSFNSYLTVFYTFQLPPTFPFPLALLNQISSFQVSITDLYLSLSVFEYFMTCIWLLLVLRVILPGFWCIHFLLNKHWFK